jgi:hypothetical protein
MTVLSPDSRGFDFILPSKLISDVRIVDSQIANTQTAPDPLFLES